MRISVIVAVAENGVIGRGGDLPWRLSNDLRRFKEITMGHAVIMGRRTWESINRPLPGRRMIVVTRQASYQTGVPEIAVAHDLPAAIAAAGASGDSEVFVIGGAELYRSALAIADRIYVTVVRAEVEGDVYFPIKFTDFDWDSWVIVHQESHEPDAKNQFPYSFITLQRCEQKP